MFGLSGLYTKLIGAGLVVLLFVGLYADRGRFMHRAHVAETANQAVCDQVRISANRPKLDCKQMAQQVQFMGDAINAVKAQRDAALASDKAHAITVESAQNEAGKGSEDDYAQKVAGIRAYYAQLLRDNEGGKASANPSRGGVQSMSSTATVAPGLIPACKQAEFLPSADAEIATEQAVRLQTILDWGKKVGIVK